MIGNVVAAALVAAGAAFFLAGTLGMLRFPDAYTRLHALTKADNLGVGLVVLGLVVHHGATLVAAKLLLIWLLVLAASGLGSYLIGRAATELGIVPWRRR